MGGAAAVSTRLDDSHVLALVQGRDTRWWKGALLHLNFLIVSCHLTMTHVLFQAER